jgi:hypothetical protein
MRNYADNVAQTSQTIGTGAYDLDDTPKGSYVTFAQAFAAADQPVYWVRNFKNTKWEKNRGGVFTPGTPDRLSRNVVLSTNGNAAVDWTTDDLPLTILIPNDSDVLEGVVTGWIGAARPSLLRAGATWFDSSAGVGVSWMHKLYNGVADLRFGLYDAVKALYFPDNRRASTAVGAASKVFDATHIGVSFTFDTASADRTATLPVGSTVKDGYHLELKGLSSAHNIVLTPDAGDGIDGGANGVTKTIPGGVLFTIRWSAADNRWTTNYITPAIAPAFAGVRQTVSAGPVDTAGLPTFLPSTAAGLVVSSQNVTAAAPLVASSANGWSATTGMPVDRTGFSTANLTWNGLTNSTTNYLYVTVNADGTLSTGSTTLAPIYQWGGTPATTNGQVTFNIAEMKAYLGNGTAAPQAYVVLMGEAVTTAGNVTSTVAYAYNGRYESGFTATLPAGSTATNFNHNIGSPPRDMNFIAECSTNDVGFVVGDQISTKSGLFTATNTPLTWMPSMTSARNVSAVATGNNANPWEAIPKAGGGQVVLTLANWKYKFFAQRGW